MSAGFVPLTDAQVEAVGSKKPGSNVAQVRWLSNPFDVELCAACRQGDAKGVKQAIEKGANPNCHINNALGETIPMSICANKGYQEIASFLVKSGAHPNSTVGFDGSTPLHIASRANQIEMVTFLIDQGYEIDNANKLKRTPLMEASACGNVDMVKLLCGKGADIDKRDQQQKTALRFRSFFFFILPPAFKKKKKKFIMYYYPKKKVPFFLKKIVLVELGADVDVSGGFANGVTILHCAAAQGDVEFVKFLVEIKGANVFSGDDNGKTPLDYAILKQKDDVVSYLRSLLTNINNNNNNSVFFFFIIINPPFVQSFYNSQLYYVHTLCVLWMLFWSFNCLLVIFTVLFFKLKKKEKY
ncbi:hypothetical protein RFI_27049 [Reticulomyxa filosa]|uniref:Uncharacterized protein n=1 Tax=Reticulomyxa filosa TaxID=46433 RepID=X6M9L5_RETFI|nr:hypothetical protein RFI_27049 [Reticulomyxa filosa]|eukprot:ETO10326.1 hypothetical protein RFI_27049 [Reticulomyxa filosa]